MTPCLCFTTTQHVVYAQLKDMFKYLFLW